MDKLAKDEQGDLFLHCGCNTPRLGLTEETARQILFNNLKDFFSEKPDYAALYRNYIDYWYQLDGESYGPEAWDEWLREEHARWKFPEEMLIKIFLAYETGHLVVKSLKEFELNKTIEIG